MSDSNGELGDFILKLATSLNRIAAHSLRVCSMCGDEIKGVSCGGLCDLCRRQLRREEDKAAERESQKEAQRIQKEGI